MSDSKQEFLPQIETKSGPKWAEMSGGKKVLYIARICVCIVSFGMIFPNAFG